MRGATSCPLALLLLLALRPGPAAASPTNVQPIVVETDANYEETLIRWAMGQEGLEHEPFPTGKRIARIVVVREDIIAETDPQPNALNSVHVKTQDSVVRQELLVEPGQLWDDEKVEESERNLRKLYVLAVARAVPCKAAHTDEVVLLVVTKDLWSIRTNFGFEQTGVVLKRLEMTPTEHNLAGLNKQLSLHLRIAQLDYDGPTIRDHFALGQAYQDPRLFGTHLKLQESFDVLMDGWVPCAGAIGPSRRVWCPGTAAGDVTGGSGHLSLGQPLYSYRTKWGFLVQGTVDARQERRYHQNNGSDLVPLGEQEGLSVRTMAWSGHPDGLSRTVPYVYDAERVVASASLTRSFGHDIKQNVSSGLGVYRDDSRVPDSFPFDEHTLAWYEQAYLPHSETDAFFFLNYASYTDSFARMSNIDTYAISEDLWLGHNVEIEARLGNNLERPAESFIEIETKSGYRWHFADNLLWLSLAAGARMQPEHEDLAPRFDDVSLVSSQLQIGLRHVSPPLGIGRFHSQVLTVLRYNDYRRWMDAGRLTAEAQSSPLIAPFGLTNQPMTMGGASGLRGYPADHFQGPNLFRVNLEYRRLPLVFYTMHTGFSLFYDGGTVWGEGLPQEFKHNVGIGLRGIFPQFNKETLRIDFGIPLAADRGSVGSWFSFGFGQAF